MNKRLYSWVVLSAVAIGFAATLPGCDDMGYGNDVADLHDKQRMNRGVPAPTELPPGLGDDLPQAAPPIAANK